MNSISAHRRSFIIGALWATLQVASFSQTAPAPKEPVGLVAIRQEYEKAVQQELAPLKKIYLQELVKLKEAYAQAADLESALAVDAEIKGEPGGKKVTALTLLQENYEKAVARVVAKLKPAYQQGLIRLKTELTKSADLQAALAVDTAIKSLDNATSGAAVATSVDVGKNQSLQAGSPVAALTSGASMNKLAVVKVEGATWERLKSGVNCYTDPKHQWKDVPEELEGVRFSVLQHMKGGTTFKVEKAGLVFFATTAKFGDGGRGSGPETMDQKGLEKMGWHHMPQFDKLSDTGTGLWMVFYKECDAGEEHYIRTHKYVSPVLLKR